VRSPTVRRRELGARLRALRTEKNLTVEQVAATVLCSASKVSRMETGHGVATPRDIRDLCDLYGVTDQAERERMLQLAREGRQQGWWQPYDLDFDTYVGLEAAAIGLKYYQSTIVPGLLQTADYARAMLEVSIPKLAPERMNELLEVKMTRQRILSREQPLRLWAVIDEAALHRVVGGPAVMAEQLQRIAEVTSNPNVTMQVIPYEAGAHPAMDSTFNILEFADSVPDVVYVEGLVGWIYLDRPAEIDKYQQVFDNLCHLALSSKESIDLVAKIGKHHLARLNNTRPNLSELCPGRSFTRTVGMLGRKDPFWYEKEG
jgi:transcriptional regulator with XRE-family HTH domain